MEDAAFVVGMAQYGGAAALNPFKDLPAEGPLFP
jgi:hypothetical protein